jgi:hypothetical protein
MGVFSHLHQFSDWGLLALCLGVGAIALLFLGGGRFALDPLLFGI